MESSLSIPADVALTASASIHDQNVDSRQDDPQTFPSSEDRGNISSACTTCRDKHLRCDGGRPCSRCQRYGYYCQYLKSRRGYRVQRRNDMQVKGSNVSLFTSDTAIKPMSFDMSLLDEGSLQYIGGSKGNYPSNPQNSVQVPMYRQRCFAGFFQFFYQSHPFLAPKEHTLAILGKKSIRHLETAICYIGSQYVCTGLTAGFALELELLLASPDMPNDGFLVQALLLFVIGLDGNDEQSRALEFLARAQKLAIQLGMHQHDFPIRNSEGCAVVEESWRRTWWELYVVEGIIAGLHQSSTFHLYDVVANVALPCEEHTFRSGYIPIPHTIDEFDELLFSNETLEWSSYTYRIVAVRNLGRILQHKEAVFLDDALLDRLDSHLINWRLHLPNSKKEYFDRTGQVDELLFQAHMITNVSSILLHRQYSLLQTIAPQSITSCAPHPEGAPGWQIRSLHSAKTIQSAADITKLITLPIPVVKHTHFLTCAIALAAIVHLSCWSVSTLKDEDEDLKGKIRLNTGGLKALADVWPSATKVLGQVTRVAQEILSTRKSALNSLIWNCLEDGEMAGSFADGEIISDNFQSF